MTELKALTPRVKAINEQGRVSVVIATLGVVDADGDVTEPGFFGRQTAQVVPVHDWDHVPIGKASIREASREAIADLEFNMSVPAAVDWYRAIKFDFENPPALQQYSYGYTVKAGGSRSGQFQGQKVRFLQPLANGAPGAVVHEVSPVLLGAGKGVRTLSVKRRTHQPPPLGMTVWEREELLEIQLRHMRAKFLQDGQARAQYKELTDIQLKHSIAYSEDLLRAVDSKTVATAYVASQTYATDLGIAPPIIRWFSEEEDDEFVEFRNARPLLGWCKPKTAPNTIWLHSKLDQVDAWSTVAHEMRHLAGGDEDEARVYDEKAEAEWRRHA